MVVLVSFARDGAWTTQIMPPEYTLDNYRRLASERQLWRPITNSIGMSAAATAANAIVCFAIAYVVVLSRAPGRRAIALLAALPWAIPATAIALGLAATFDRNAPAELRVLLVGTFWILPLAYFVRNIPLVTSAVEGSLRQMDPTLEDAARGLGASRWLALRRVVIPAARPGLVAGTMLAGVAAVGEFVASVVLYTHASRPISVEILSQVRNTAFGTAAAYSVLLHPARARDHGRRTVARGARHRCRARRRRGGERRPRLSVGNGLWRRGLAALRNACGDRRLRMPTARASAGCAARWMPALLVMTIDRVRARPLRPGCARVWRRDVVGAFVRRASHPAIAGARCGDRQRVLANRRRDAGHRNVGVAGVQRSAFARAGASAWPSARDPVRRAGGTPARGRLARACRTSLVDSACGA
jgi:ABC-type spermidine/putrescine transport system permease subunit II